MFKKKSTDSNPSVLITGANGFVGARLCRKFLNEGYHVIAGVRQNANLSQLDGIDVEFRYGEITQPDTLQEMVKDVDYLIHNAGVIKANNKQRYFEVNGTGTHNVFDVIAKYNPRIKKVIYISSQAAAGPSRKGKPVTESDKPHPITTYGRSKLAGEHAVLSFKDRLSVVVVRPTAVYGPGDRGIFTFFEVINKGIKPLFGNVRRRLNIVHVDDLCDGVCRAVRKDTESGAVYFICESQSYSMEELIGHLEKAGGRPTRAIPIPGSIFRAVAVLSETFFKLVGATPMLTREKARELLGWWEVSTEKAHRELGFKARIPFSEGARETFEWYRREGWLK